MTNKTVSTLKAASAAAAIFLAAMCGCTHPSEPSFPDVGNVTVNTPTLTLKVGESATLTATVTPEGVESAEVVWSSDNVSVATVDASTGEVKAVSVGNAVITATSRVGGKSGRCAVTVESGGILDYITDPVFKAYALFCMNNENSGFDEHGVSKSYPLWDTDRDGKLSRDEAAAVECVYLRGAHGRERVKTLAGISHFTGLKSLYCSDNELTELDVKNNTVLKVLYCYSNRLTALDVTQNSALTGLYCSNNELQALDVTQNSALTSLDCCRNQLQALDVTQNSALTTLACHSNQLPKLDVQNNTALTGLSCYRNQLQELDVTKNTALTFLECGSNQLTQLNVTQNTALLFLECWGNQLTELDVTKNTALKEFSCRTNQLSEFDVMQNAALTFLDCGDNLLTKLDVTNNTALISLKCGFNQLTELNVTQNSALTQLICESNQLSELDVTSNSALTSLECGSNQLKELDASKMASPDEYHLLCGKQRNSEGDESLTLTLRKEQKDHWNSDLATQAGNEGIVLAE